MFVFFSRSGILSVLASRSLKQIAKLEKTAKMINKIFWFSSDDFTAKIRS